MILIDFTRCPHRNKTYGGANGSKICVEYDNNLYMLKFPPTPTKNEDMSYTNSCISEYLGCHILNKLGIKAQETLLGTYVTYSGNRKEVVACKDFTGEGYVLQDFGSLKNQIVDSVRNGYGTELSDIIKTIEEQRFMDAKVLSDFFWDLFIADAFIGNWDRHNGNWGFLYNQDTDNIKLAPIFDCGSCLYPQADEGLIRKILNNKNEIAARIYNVPLAAIKENNKKIRYFDFISSLKNEDCNAALCRMAPKISNIINEICSLINEIPNITPLQKEFYTTMLYERNKKIIQYSYNKLQKDMCNQKVKKAKRR